MATVESATDQPGSPELKKELGLIDLILMQFLTVTSTTWLGAAGKLGAAHIIFWLVAVLLFHLPLAATVFYLSRRMPHEGGLYVWVKNAFGMRVAFMVGWNIWLFSVVSVALIGIQVATYLSYALGPNAAWLEASSWFSAVASIIVCLALAVLAILGFGTTKWLHNMSAVALFLACIALLGLPLVHLVRGSLYQYPIIPHDVPKLSFKTLSILGKMGFGAFCGFEYVAVVSGECRDPVRAIGRSVLLASIAVVGVYILGTASVLAFVPTDKINSVSPISQVLSIGLAPLGAFADATPVVILVLFICSLAGGSISFTTATRLPMVAGWDHDVLPPWFGRLHPKLRTPVNAILVTVGVVLAVGLCSLIGVHQEESFQLLLNASLVCYALTYLVMFAILLDPRQPRDGQRTLWLPVGALVGFAMTLLYIVTAVIPIVEVKSAMGFSGRIIGVVFVGNIVGALVLHLARWNVKPGKASA